MCRGHKISSYDEKKLWKQVIKKFIINEYFFLIKYKTTGPDEDGMLTF